jgi:WD40 repeat protein
MRIKSKWAWGIGVIAFIGAALWMRELASWRPQTVARVAFHASRMLFSRDGKRLIVTDNSGNSGDKQIFNWKGGQVDASAKALRAFDSDVYEVSSFSFELSKESMRIDFFPPRGAKVRLQTPDQIKSKDEYLSGVTSALTYVRARSEICGSSNGALWVWDARSGKLKYRVRCPFDLRRGVFSPDGKWFVAADSEGMQDSLGRYAVRTGKKAQTINPSGSFPHFDFSPDGRYFWFMQGDVGQAKSIIVMDARTWKSLAHIPCSAPVKWVSPGRLGIVQASHFEWLDMATGKHTSLPGPLGAVADWALSPDGRWIYSVERNGTIRKWRAR